MQASTAGANVSARDARLRPRTGSRWRELLAMTCSLSIIMLDWLAP